MIRAFFAITLDDNIRQQLFKAGTNLKEKLNMSVKWVKENHLHLTLRFIGNIETSQIQPLVTSLKGLEDLPAFPLTFSDIIAFPQQKPRVIGMGIEESDRLNQLVNCITDKLINLGYEPEDRQFLPHITLGRIAKPRRKGLVFENQDLPKKQIVSTVTLFKSELSPEGSVYSILHEFPLRE